MLGKLRRAISELAKKLRKGDVGKKDIEDALLKVEEVLLQAGAPVELVEKVEERIREAVLEKGTEDVEREVWGELERYFRKKVRKGPDVLDIQERPAKVLFVGPNGAGKTTTIGKIAWYLRNKGKRVVIAAADTFRAGSIEQVEIWGKRVGARVVKGEYGADPASVAYNAVESAKARGEDYVLVDTAGRQETNRNLMRELEKIKRVVSPHMTLLVMEAGIGSSAVSQIEVYRRLGIDGIVITKWDAVKGIGALFAAGYLNVPISYIGTGQGKEDLIPYDPDEVLKAIKT